MMKGVQQKKKPVEVTTKDNLQKIPDRKESVRNSQQSSGNNNGCNEPSG